MGWDIEDEFDAETSGWAEKVHSTIPRIEEDEMVLLRRIEKKLEVEEGQEGVDVLDPKDTRFGNFGEGTGGNEVATEAEERGFVGPSEWERGQV
jgi:hypothetical protein